MVESNRCASSALRRRPQLLVLAALCLVPAFAFAQEQASSDRGQPSRRETVGRFFAGAAIAFASHEAAHLAFDVAFDADPRLKRVDFHGIPFFAITHRADVSPRQRLTIASAGFWVQHAGNEWILSRTPDLRRRQAPLRKGMVAFNVLASMAYAGGAFARTGPGERDTRGIAQGAGIDERWVGVMVLAPAVFDTVRYVDPDAKWPVWASRAAKAGLVLLVLK